MSLEGGSEEFASSDAIGACMSCGQRAAVFHNGHCSECAGVPSVPPRSRLEFLRSQRQTFEIAITKTGDPFKRRHYRAAADRIAAQLEEEA